MDGFSSATILILLAGEARGTKSEITSAATACAVCWYLRGAYWYGLVRLQYSSYWRLGRVVLDLKLHRPPLHVLYAGTCVGPTGTAVLDLVSMRRTKFSKSATVLLPVIVRVVKVLCAGTCVGPTGTAVLDLNLVSMHRTKFSKSTTVLLPVIVRVVKFNIELLY